MALWILLTQGRGVAVLLPRFFHTAKHAEGTLCGSYVLLCAPVLHCEQLHCAGVNVPQVKGPPQARLAETWGPVCEDAPRLSRPQTTQRDPPVSLQKCSQSCWVGVQLAGTRGPLEVTELESKAVEEAASWARYFWTWPCPTTSSKGRCQEGSQ